MSNTAVPKYLSNSQAVLSLKIQSQFIDRPRLIVSDFDGTLFTPDLRIISEILHYNRQLRSRLRRKRIPLIINTGRNHWSEKAKQDAKILGIHPDIVIVGGGTMIYHKTTKGDFVLDTRWKAILDSTKVAYSTRELTWGKDAEMLGVYITETVNRWATKANVYLRRIEGSTVQIRYIIRNTETALLPSLIASLQQQFHSGIKVIYAESIFSNKLGFPTGELMIIPGSAGKDNALKYLLHQYITAVNSPLEAFCFGDGAIDLTSFLCMPSTKKYTLKQFLINPTLLAKTLFTITPRASRVKLLSISGPKAILYLLEEHLSATQNNALRRYIVEPGKYLLDKIYPGELSANDITLSGLLKIMEAINTLYERKSSTGKAFTQYLLGLFADIADGIRARQTFVTKQGQLADDFADRVREFYQLYVRGKKRLEQEPEQSLMTFEAAISCILTGLMRRQAELNGVSFNEGSTLWRTKELFLSLLCDTALKQHKKSLQIDKNVLRVSEATYLERLQKAGSFTLNSVKKRRFSLTQKKTLERWLLYVQLLQEEHSLVLHILPESMHKRYRQWLASNFLEYYLDGINVRKMREMFGLKDYCFSLNNYNQYFHNWN